jgi:hypothetical protein
MLNKVKHLLWAFPNSFAKPREAKSRFFVAVSILSVAEGLLRMTLDGTVGHQVMGI